MIFFLFFAAANFKLSGRLIRPQKKWPPPAAISFRFIYALLYLHLPQLMHIRPGVKFQLRWAWGRYGPRW